ncbi:MAG: hypothetical protein N2111_14015 [Candidatus Sumerlaeaceae bacterium]|nr:hypothetical protein [Candidatus Sumerlaeaceae bacterium]
MSLFERQTEVGVCMLLEKKHVSDEESDIMPEEGALHEGGNYTCGYTGRVNGPDFRPADPKMCVKGRPCFKQHQMF